LKLAKNQIKKQEMGQFQIEIPSILDNLRIVESFIDNAKDQLNITDEIYGNIVISLTESVNNAIVYGNLGDKNKMVTISLDFEDSNLRFLVTDEGVGFDHELLPDPTSPDNIEKEAGRGIFLMKHLCDEVNFIHPGNKVELVFYFNE
jgi:anti-sigma regulatory factor (Ser/Thr protein kinase)